MSCWPKLSIWLRPIDVAEHETRGGPSRYRHVSSHDLRGPEEASINRQAFELWSQLTPCAVMRLLPFRWRRGDRAGPSAAPSYRLQSKRALLAIVASIAFACSLAGVIPPAAADSNVKAPAFINARAAAYRAAAYKALAYSNAKAALDLQRADPHAQKQSVDKIPKGPLQIIISVDQQKLHLYAGGTHVADTPVATGVPDHPTPLGIFSIIQKARDHRSNIYSDAPMPFMERITWSGVALHEGGNLGHPASHGCIRMSHDFAVRLWGLTRLGVRVVIAQPELRPQDIADPRLFAHSEKPTDSGENAAAPTPTPAGQLLRTVDTVEGDKTTDALHQEAENAAMTVGDAIDPPATAAADATPAAEPGGAAPAEAAPAADPVDVPTPPAKPAEAARSAYGPIAIFVSGKNKRIYVRQNFSPLFDAPVTIEHPEAPLGTHVFTAMDYLNDGSSFRWNVISMPSEQAKPTRLALYDWSFGKYGKRQEARVGKVASSASVETPQQALARIQIPQDVIDQISHLIVPGSSLIISDQGLGEETGEGTNFIVVSH
jgi:lipoprotein-anchoring transpeptidase ErfK/SrfK